MTSSVSSMNFCVVGDEVDVNDRGGQLEVLRRRISAVLEQGGREPPDLDRWPDEGDEEAGGVSVMLIETRDGEGRAEQPR
jgi:hypothetical protein